MRAVGPLIKNGEGDRGDHEDDRRPGSKPREHVCRCAGAEGCLRALAAEGACEVGRAALLKEHYANEKQAHNNVKYDDKNEKNLHFLSCFPCLPTNFGAGDSWCGGGDLNPYASRRQHLKLVCLPISPPPHRGELYKYSKGRERNDPACRERGRFQNADYLPKENVTLIVV